MTGLSFLRSQFALAALGLVTTVAHALKYDADYVQWNLNTNQEATNPLEYSGRRPDGFAYNPSPDNWRIPFYTVFLDRFINGDPTNDNANNTLFEHDAFATQLRYGGDLVGLVDSLDYIAGMGIKAIYIAGSPFINMGYKSDSYSPLDLSFLDWHYGTLATWQNAIDEIHARNMYVVMDNTMATLGDLIGFEGYLNSSAPFDKRGYKVAWKSDRRYLDFAFGNEHNDSCVFPTFWYENGTVIDPGFEGCYNSDFDQFGDVEAFGVYPDWQRQLSKFASVQDRLREWEPAVRARLETFGCMQIAQLDIDGFRVDKAMQVTVDAQASYNVAMRTCAARHNKNNFLIIGEITSGNTLGSIWLGRGRTPTMASAFKGELATVLALTSNTSGADQYYVREVGNNGLDAGAFHYTVYRALTQFLGMSGNLTAGYDLEADWFKIWQGFVLTNDLINPNTGVFDPRHLYGVSNQDLFRWPAIELGTERMMLGYMVTTLLLPGIPLVYYGEEQDFYVLDNTANNYVFGRQAMGPSPAWKLHGCYKMNNSNYVDWPLHKGRTGCSDDSVARDHRDPSSPMRNMIRRLFQLRDEYAVLEGGWLLEELASKTTTTRLAGSGQNSTFGIWSAVRAMYPGVQDVTAASPVWMVYHNRANVTTYTFDCTNTSDVALIGPFDAGAEVRNLLDYSGATTELAASSLTNTFTGARAGCLDSVTLAPFEFRVYVPATQYVAPRPMMTRFAPGHDVSVDTTGWDGTLALRLEFSADMGGADCSAVTAAMAARLTTTGRDNGTAVQIGPATCGAMTDATPLAVTGYVPSTWAWSATLTGLDDGIVSITIGNISSAAGVWTNAIDHLLVRLGKPDNPVVFPQTGNYSRKLLVQEGDRLAVNHSAPGATSWRYSTNFGSTWSAWYTYQGSGAPIQITKQDWSGTAQQAWQGTHLQVQYWSRPLGSSSFVQHADSGDFVYQRVMPHLHLSGDYNQWGFDSGLPGSMDLYADHTWSLHFMYEWPSSVQLSVWGINPDNKPDQSFNYGDVDGDGVLDRLPPDSLASNVVNISQPPPWPFVSYRMLVHDQSWTYDKVGQGDVRVQMALFVVLLLMPLVLAGLAGWIYMQSFYQVKINQSGFAMTTWKPLRPLSRLDLAKAAPKSTAAAVGEGERRTVLMATMEYNMDDLKIKIKIGGLGVMAQLMASALPHVNLVWVVPVVGDVAYPFDKMEAAESMYVQVMEQPYEIQVHYHQTRNITYVVLDAPIFRKQTRASPYQARMDDIESAILYAAWNSCIAEAIRRFSVDVYHINDYHGAAAPLYLLPQTVPCCLSLHNAEFQGMWPMRTPAEQKEVCGVFNLPADVVKEYVQYGSVFNLLHAAASYLRTYQRGFGAVGVSRKYGDRSLARYPIFWSLKNIGQLPNPDPSDTAAWDPSMDVQASADDVVVDRGLEEKRPGLRRQAQEWAGLDVDPTAELFVFVGRWSLQKGVDLVADIFPSILDRYAKTQLICIGPVIDLYGRFAALKLEKLMQKYPRRVFSKPEFTQLPPYIFGGAEFALIPSRDEPFGLVAVEFGRKGALGVGARVGGLGQMPGFWYTIESMSPSHLLQQFRGAIVAALECKAEKRALMRAWSAKQRFPVAQWVKQLDELYAQCIRIHKKEARRKKLEMTGASTTVSTRPSSRGSSLAAHNSVSAMSDTAVDAANPISPLSPPRIASPLLDGRPQSPGLSVPNAPWSGSSPSPRGSVVSNADCSVRGSMASVDSFALRAQQDGPGLPSLPLPRPGFAFDNRRNSSLLSLPDVLGDRHDMKLQQVDQFFNDANGEFYAEFADMLDGLTARNSTTDLCIESFLKKSEKQWFARYRDAKLGLRASSRTRDSSPVGSRPSSRSGHNGRNESVVSRGRQRHRSRTPSGLARSEFESDSPIDHNIDDEFLLGEGYEAPKGLRKILSIRLGDWPLYSLLLALQQIIAASSYQLVLLTGKTYQTPAKLYAVSASYIIGSVAWWMTVRRLQAVYPLSCAWFFYGIGFLLMGLAAFVSPWQAQEAMQLVATCLYAVGASSGVLGFALNFGDEGGSPTKQWITRALVVAGLQQLYSLALWWWGSLVSNSYLSMKGFVAGTKLPQVTAICLPVAFALWAIGIVLLLGLPDFYRQMPLNIPGFYVSLYRRRIVPWFFVTIVIQNYWLSSQYGRSWSFLFASQYLPGWGTFLLALFFIFVLWGLVLVGFSHFSNEHTWILPIFAVGLVAPRWAQEFWATSGIGWYLPWVGSGFGSAVLSRCLWLWLGLMDNLQGVGVGMMLLATLTRQHVLAVLVGAQIVGSVFTMLAKATSPNALSPNTTFPDLSQGLLISFDNKWFWICLLMQLVVPVGFFKFFRKEQVSKP